ncbi:MAG TPA: CPBP family intramembrane metalloprotease [Candidatus Merdenecus merdavium]|nr:CPBP family intramembrane metalloprotease [Candidatus Merdenecus merdavium]
MKKISKYLFACLPFLMVMGIMLLVPNIIMIFLMIFHTSTDYFQGIEAAYSAYMNNLNLVSVIMYICALIPVGFWYYYKVYKVKKQYKQNWYFRPSGVGSTALLALGVSHSMSLLFLFLSILMPKALNNYSELVESSGMLSYSVIWVFSSLILPPLMEEMLFRGLIMTMFRRAGATFVVANILQAVLFGIFHMNLVQGIYAFLLGVIMGYLVKQYNTLLASMTFHALFNFFGTFLTDLENKFFNGYLNFLTMILGLLLTGFSLYLISRQKLPVRKVTKPVLRQTPYDDWGSYHN